MGRRKSGGAVVADPHPVDDPPADTAPQSGGEKQQPAHKIRMRNISCAIWENKSDGGAWYSVTFQRGYKGTDNQWHASNSFGIADLLMLAEVSRAACLWILNATQDETRPLQTNGSRAPTGGTRVDGDGGDIPF